MDENTRQQRKRPPSQTKRKKAKSKRRRKQMLIFKMLLMIILIAAVLFSALFWKKYGPSKERADLEEYYGITAKEQIAVVIDNQNIGAKGMMFDSEPYIEYAVVRDFLNERFYLDANENLLLYTLPEGTLSVGVGAKEAQIGARKQSEKYAILKTEGSVAYIALDFVQKYTNIDYKLYDDEVKRVMIVSDWGKTTTAVVKRDTQVRYRAGVKSPVLTDIAKRDKVTFIEDEGKWKKIRTEDGYIGYVRDNCLKSQKEETISREFKEQEYSNISKDYTINLAWHQVTSKQANSGVLETIAGTKGLTTLSPTWFTVRDTNGNIDSIASAEYVNYAHQSNIEVWALVRDFDGGIGSYEETYELLSHTSRRERLINQLIAEAIQTGIDGINVDFEKVSEECGEHFIQFIRELSIKCDQNHLVLSVDNYVPKGYNAQYHRKEQSVFADYIIIMGYDEHYNGSYESGSVASYNFVKEGIEETLKEVPAEKVINAIPFYTRLWAEIPKSEAELESQAGTEAANYPTKVQGEAMGMETAMERIEGAGAEITWDEEARQDYAQWEGGGAVYKIWLENAKSLEEKLKLMKEHKLAGTAAWKLGFETPDIWELILKYVN